MWRRAVPAQRIQSSSQVLINDLGSIHTFFVGNTLQILALLVGQLYLLGSKNLNPAALHTDSLMGTGFGGLS